MVRTVKRDIVPIMRTRDRHLFFLKIQQNCHFDATRFPSDRTADGDLLFAFSSNILDFQRILSSY